MIDLKSNIETINILFKIVKKYLGKKVEVIFEFGSRYGEDTIEFAKIYPQSKIYAFECNPNTLAICKKNTEKYLNIKLIEKAVGDIDGTIKFYPINPAKTITTWEDGNQGASSLFKASGKYPIENYVQDEVDVPIVKLSTIMKEYSLSHIDILWMDIQGAELLALRGLENQLDNVHFIHTEVEFMEIYDSQPLFTEIKNYLLCYDFFFYGFTNKSEFSGDAVFINKKIVPKRIFLLYVVTSSKYLLKLKMVVKYFFGRLLNIVR
jgi:FkbM family methyltransferase